MVFLKSEIFHKGDADTLDTRISNSSDFTFPRSGSHTIHDFGIDQVNVGTKITTFDR